MVNVRPDGTVTVPLTVTGLPADVQVVSELTDPLTCADATGSAATRDARNQKLKRSDDMHPPTENLMMDERGKRQPGRASLRQ
jgi:hypothetical protein